MVQQSGIETLQCDRQLLTEKQTFPFIAGGWADSVTQNTGIARDLWRFTNVLWLNWLIDWTGSTLNHWEDPTTQSLLAWKRRTQGGYCYYYFQGGQIITCITQEQGIAGHSKLLEELNTWCTIHGKTSETQLMIRMHRIWPFVVQCRRLVV